MTANGGLEQQEHLSGDAPSLPAGVFVSLLCPYTAFSGVSSLPSLSYKDVSGGTQDPPA